MAQEMIRSSASTGIADPSRWRCRRVSAQRFAFAVLALGLASGAFAHTGREIVPAPPAQELVPTAAQAMSFALGALDVSVLRDGGLSISNDGSVFGVNSSPAAVAKVLREAGAPTAKVRIDIDALLIRMPGHLVLIDTGWGPAGHGVLLRSLALLGLSPYDITDILITHAHPDHTGGLVDAIGRLAFPRATVRMSAREWTFMQSASDLPAEARVIKAQVQTFAPGRPILPGITPVDLPGHTPGQVGYEITSQGHTLFDIADVVHSSIIGLARPRWTNGWDVDREEAVRTRLRLLQQLAATDELIFAPHFPFPGVGSIGRAGRGFKFQPEVSPSQNGPGH